MDESKHNVHFDGSLDNIVEANLPRGSRQNFAVCPDHGAIMNLFCTACVKGVCYRCLIETHNGHPLEYYHIATTRGRAIRNALSWEIEDAINAFTVGIRRVSMVQNSVERKAEIAKKDIKNYIRHCHTALDKRERDLLRRLSLVKKEKKSLLEQQRTEIQDQLNSLLKSHDKLHNHFSLVDPVIQAEVNSEALRELTISKDIRLNPASNDRVQFWRDFNMRIRMRHYLGLLEIGEDFIPKQEEDRGYSSPEVTDSEVD